MSGQWKYEAAPVHYALLFYPALWAYLYFTARHILKVRSLRTIVYPLFFLVFFAALYAVFMIWGSLVLWSLPVSVPVGILVLIGIIVFSLKQDIREKVSPLKAEDLEFEQKGLELIALIVVPVLLTALAFSALAKKDTAAVPAAEPKKEKAVSAPVREIPLTAGCEYLSGLLEQAAANVQIRADDSEEQIVSAYQNEFQKQDIYGKIELHRSDQNSGAFYLYRDKFVWLIFTFEKKGKCEAGTSNCFWSFSHSKNPCIQYVTADKKNGQ